MSDAVPPPRRSARVRSALVGFGHKPEMVALATLLTLTAFLWPVCRATLGAAGLASEPVVEDLDRAALLLAAQVRVADETRLASLEEAQRRSDETNRRLEEVIARQAEALTAIAMADRSGDGSARVESARVVEALEQAAQGNLGIAESVLRDLAGQQERDHRPAEAARTYGRLGDLYSMRDQRRSHDAYRAAARLAPGDPEAWWSVFRTATNLDELASREEAVERGAAAAVAAGDESFRIKFLGARARVLFDRVDATAALAASDEAAAAAAAALADGTDDFDFLASCVGTLVTSASDHARYNEADRRRGVEIAGQALGFLRAHDERHPGAVPGGVYAWVWTTLGTCQHQAGDLQAARESLETALALREEIRAEFPDDPVHQMRRLSTYARLGNACAGLGDFAAATRYYEAGLAETTQLAEMDPENLELQRGILLCHLHLGKTALDVDDPETARAHLARALALSERLRQTGPDRPLYLNDAVGIQLTMWMAQRDHDPAAADRHARAGLELAGLLEERGQLSTSSVEFVAEVREVLAAATAAE